MDDLDQIDVRRLLKLIVLYDRNIPTKELQKRLRRQGVAMTSWLVSFMRRSFLHDLKLIAEAGLLRGPLPKLKIRNCVRRIRPRKYREEPRGWWREDRD